MQKDEFTNEDIENAEHLVNSYLQQVDTHLPELKR